MKNYILTLIVAFCSLTANAYDIEDNDIYYNVISLQDMTVGVAGAGNLKGDVVIPSTVTYNGRTFSVTKILSQALRNLTLNNLTIPNSIKEIEGGAIYFYSRNTPAYLWIPTDNQIEILGGNAIVANDGNVIADIKLPKLKKYNLCWPSVVGDGITVSIPDNIEYLTASNNFGFGNCKKLIFEPGVSDTISLDPTTSIQYQASIKELYYGRSIFVKYYKTSWYPQEKILSVVLFNNIHKLTIPITEDGVYNLDPFQLDDIDTLICYAPTPPASIRATTSKTYMNAKVFVPDESIAQYKAHSIWGQFWNIFPMSELGEKSKCVTPSISYADNKLKIESSTSGSKCYYTISDADVVSNAVVNGDISLTSTYKISAYAMADGYENSDVASATLCYIDGTFTTDGVETVQSAKRAIVLSSNNGTICVSGLECGEEVSLYSIDGQKESSVIATSSSAILEGKSLLSKVGIVKVGNSKVKLLIK